MKVEEEIQKLVLNANTFATHFVGHALGADVTPLKQTETISKVKSCLHGNWFWSYGDQKSDSTENDT